MRLKDAVKRQIDGSVTDLDRWRQVVLTWLMRGYRPNNVAGMLDWYRDGIPDSSGKGSARDRVIQSSKNAIRAYLEAG